MQKTKLLFFLFFAIILNGCASKPTQTERLIWEYEKSAPPSCSSLSGLSTDKKYNSIGKSEMIIGALSGSFGSAVQSGIKLSPSDLNQVIIDALTQPFQKQAKTGIQTFAEGSNIGKVGRWGIEESNEGQITTYWKSISGRMAGLLWWKKEYQTEARHIITINRSYRSSDLTNYSIATEVRERPNANYKWAPGDPELGRESFNEIKMVLLNSVRMWQTSWRIDTNEN